MPRRRHCEFCGRDTNNKCGVCEVCLNAPHEYREWVERVPNLLDEPKHKRKTNAQLAKTLPQRKVVP
jgi:hypothetical protein